VLTHVSGGPDGISALRLCRISVTGLAILRRTSEGYLVNYYALGLFGKPVAAGAATDCRSFSPGVREDSGDRRVQEPDHLFPPAPTKEVVVIDPLTEPLELSELNGSLAASDTWQSLWISSRPKNPGNGKRFGLVFCGMDLNRQEDTPDVMAGYGVQVFYRS